MSQSTAIALVGALILGAMAGAGTSIALQQPAGGGASADSELSSRVSDLEQALERSRDTAADRKRQLGHMADRVMETELRLAQLQRELAALEGRGPTAPEPVEPGVDPSRPVRPGPGVIVPSPGGPVHVVPQDPEARKKAVERWRQVSELRSLSEEDRWARIQEELRLSVNQVDEIKAALAARKEALEAATEETEIDMGGFKGSISRVTDPEAHKAASEAFDERVERTLDNEQRKLWRDGAYKQALGVGGGTAGSAVIRLGAGPGGRKPSTGGPADE